MDLPPRILELRPEEAVRRLALAELAHARTQAERLDDPADAEALHDFRVAVRRLHSTLRLWRPLLRRSVRRKHERALRKLQRATGAGRDAEVALDWLREESRSLGERDRLGHDWLVARLEARLAENLAHARSRVRRAFERCAAGLGERLPQLRVDVRLDRGEAGPSFASVLAVRARKEARRLARRLGEIDSAAARERVHEARIAGKRLRYLIEPLRTPADAGVVVKQLKRLQDLLGEMHDAHVLSETLGEAIEEAAAERALLLHDIAAETPMDRRLASEAERSERAGLLELTRRNALRAQRLFGTLEREWFGSGVERLLEEVETLANRLEARAAAQRHVEIERKYLLDGMPDLALLRARGVPIEVWEVEQGWLPGERLRERVRRLRVLEPQPGRQPRRESFVRTVKLGAGVERIEIEESCSEPVFRALWPLTEGCRIHKLRHRVEQDGLVFEIDDFHGRELVLAEVELDDPATHPDLPDWLAPHVVREVTDDPSYTNLKLAR